MTLQAAQVDGNAGGQLDADDVVMAGVRGRRTEVSIVATSAALPMMDSENRKPAASSASLPGVRIVIETLRVARPPGVEWAMRISRGSSAATRSVSAARRAPLTLLISTA